MKVVIALDSFKGNMRSATVGGIIREAIFRETPDAEVMTFPMVDGGEGTVDAVVAATGGTVEVSTVCGPLGEPVNAPYGLLPDGTAIMEMAAVNIRLAMRCYEPLDGPERVLLAFLGPSKGRRPNW